MAKHVVPGDQLSAITREVVRIKASDYGKGATEAKTYQCDNFLFCVLKGGMTPVEENLLEHGEAQMVRQYRLRFQEANGSNFRGAVERITGIEVLSYESQVLFSPAYTVEIFVLGGPIEGAQTADERG
jgi:uncharacterized protein YbcI